MPYFIVASMQICICPVPEYTMANFQPSPGHCAPSIQPILALFIALVLINSSQLAVSEGLSQLVQHMLKTSVAYML